MGMLGRHGGIPPLRHRRPRLLFVLCIALSISLVGLLQEPSALFAAPRAKGWARGQVKNSPTGMGIAASIKAAGPATWNGQTDSQGYFKVRLPAATYTFTASASGYSPQSKIVSIQSGKTTTVTFNLEPATVSPSPPPSSGQLVTDPYLVLSPPDLPKPAYMALIAPSPLTVPITRIVGDPGTTIVFSNGGSGTWGADTRHHYGNDQPWNSDGTLVVLQNLGGGSPEQIYLDGNTYQPKFGKCSNYNLRDDRWHPTQPSIRINGDGTFLQWFDVVRCAVVRSWTLPVSVNYLGMTDGDISRDGRFIVLGNSTQMFVVDMDPQPPYATYPNQRIGPVVNITHSGYAVAHMTISPSGKYAIVAYSGDYIRVFDIDSTTLMMTPRPMPTLYPGCHGAARDGFIYDLGHSDLTLNPYDNSEDVIVGQEHCGNVGKLINGLPMGHVVAVRLRDGWPTALTDPANEAYAYHISARAVNRPGWIYVSYYEYESGERFDGEIIAVRLDGSQSIERLAHHHTDTSNCYRCEAHPVPSRDGMRLLFASAWNYACATLCGTQSVRQSYAVDTRMLRSAVGWQFPQRSRVSRAPHLR